MNRGEWATRYPGDARVWGDRDDGHAGQNGAGQAAGEADKRTIGQSDLQSKRFNGDLTYACSDCPIKSRHPWALAVRRPVNGPLCSLKQKFDLDRFIRELNFATLDSF